MNFAIGTEDAGARLDVFLRGIMPNVSRSQLQVLNRHGRIRVNGRVEKSGYRLRAHDRVDVDLPEPSSAALQPEDIPLTVRYEDPDLAVIEKPAGMVVHPGAGNRSGTLVHALLTRFPDLSRLGGQRPGIVHRIDRLTSGLIVVARTNEAYHSLTGSFQARQVRKVYIAAVHGVFGTDSGEIDLPVRRHARVRTRMAAVPGGRVAHTAYRVLERGRSFSLLEVAIRTGRTHQIRVHFSAIGHPVVGDPTYGSKQHQAFLRRFPDPGRYFLHAALLGFPHPGTGELLTFESPMPPELVELWVRLKAGS